MDLVDTEQVDQKQLLTLAKGIVISGGAYIVLGPSGSGKTYIFHQACSKAKVRPIMVNLSVLERPDFMGMPFRERGRQRWATPSFDPIKGKTSSLGSRSTPNLSLYQSAMASLSLTSAASFGRG